MVTEPSIKAKTDASIGTLPGMSEAGHEWGTALDRWGEPRSFLSRGTAGDAVIGDLLNPTVARHLGDSTMLRRGYEFLPDRVVNTCNV